MRPASLLLHEHRAHFINEGHDMSCPYDRNVAKIKRGQFGSLTRSA
jgi:hypothetical protein